MAEGKKASCAIGEKDTEPKKEVVDVAPGVKSASETAAAEKKSAPQKEVTALIGKDTAQVTPIRDESSRFRAVIEAAVEKARVSGLSSYIPALKFHYSRNHAVYPLLFEDSLLPLSGLVSIGHLRGLMNTPKQPANLILQLTKYANEVFDKSVKECLSAGISESELKVKLGVLAACAERQIIEERRMARNFGFHSPAAAENDVVRGVMRERTDNWSKRLAKESTTSPPSEAVDPTVEPLQSERDIDFGTAPVSRAEREGVEWAKRSTEALQEQIDKARVIVDPPPGRVTLANPDLLPLVSGTPGDRIDFKYMYNRLVTATGWTREEIGKRPFTEILDLLEYWRDYPPAHESLNRLANLLSPTLADRLSKIVSSPNERPETANSGNGQVPSPPQLKAPKESLTAGFPAVSAKRQDVVSPILKKKRWTRGKWATEAGIGKNCVYEYLDGTRNPTDANRQAMAEALGIKVEDLPE